MDTKKASEWAQILSLPFGAYCAYGVWVSQRGSSQSQPTPDQFAGGWFSSTAILLTLGAFAGLTVLSVVLLVLSRRTHQKAVQKSTEPQPEAALDPPTVSEWPTVMIFRHDEARQKNQPAFQQIVDQFAQAGWRIETATTNLPQDATGIRIRGGTSFEREMAKWGLSGLGIEWEQDHPHDPPRTLQVIVGYYESAPLGRTEQRALAPIRVLERFHMVLTGLREHMDHVLDLGKLADKAPESSHLIQLEIGLNRVREELMNLSPSVFPTATALDFQKPQISYVELERRLPSSMEALLKKVHHHWSIYAERAGISPIRYGQSPVVKLDDL